MQPMPFDAPGSVTFDGNDVIVGNQSSIMGDQSHMALLAIAVGEPGLPQSLPPAVTTRRPHRGRRPHRHHRPRPRHRKHPPQAPTT
jgi:hypothetical protein